jgi:hypothetical protein
MKRNPRPNPKVKAWRFKEKLFKEQKREAEYNEKEKSETNT